ncbi:MAG: Spi family protease inhibitor, partial [Candidatus Thorarchaeota archaeon]
MSRKRHASSSSVHIDFSSQVLLVGLALLLLASVNVWAKPVTKAEAEKMVRGFLKRSPEPLGASLGALISKTDVFTDDDNETVYYVVYTWPSGFVVVPADDGVEPIIAIVAQGTYDPSPDN